MWIISQSCYQTVGRGSGSEEKRDIVKKPVMWGERIKVTCAHLVTWSTQTHNRLRGVFLIYLALLNHDMLQKYKMLDDANLPKLC